MLTRLKLAARSNPRLFALFWRLQESERMKRRVVRRGDAAVIEGFPRSANTFATYAFLAAQGEGLRIGNHFHSPAQIFLARAYGIPAMVVVRKPEEAILSYMVFRPTLSFEEAAWRYADFHERLSGVPDAFVVAPFEQVTSDFGACIARMNRFFGAHFATFEHSEAEDRRIKERIEQDRLARLGRDGDTGASALRSTVPSQAKEARKAAIAAEARSDRAQRALARANRAYDVMLGHKSLKAWPGPG